MGYDSRPATTADRIAERLRAEIIGGRLHPGAALRQEALAEELGVSRMPIRDALNQLQAEGLVALLPNRGAFVASLSLEECAELFDLRVMLECDAAERAVPRHTQSSILRLRHAQAELEAADDRDSWAAIDRRFHELLYEPCGRPRTLAIIAELRNRVERFYLATLTPESHRSGWKLEHRDILKSVSAGNAQAVREALRKHLRETQQVVIQAIQSGD
jgi:DNA-binding GntR family transcriptional regulator